MKFYFILLCCLFLFTDCQPKGESGQSVQQARNYDDDNRRDSDNDDDNRRDSDNKDRASRGDLKDGGDCNDDDDCIDKCDDLFRAGNPEDECVELSSNEVDAIHEAFEKERGLLADPDYDDIRDIHPEAITIALEIDSNIWQDLMNDYSTREAEQVLQWIAEDDQVWQSVSSVLDEDDEEDFLKDLLREFKENDLTGALTKEIGDRSKPEDTFIYLALKVNNKRVVHVAHNVLIEDYDSSSSPYRSVNDKDHEEAAYALGEVYCKKDDNDYIFEDVFEEIIDLFGELEDYIESGDRATKQGLAIDGNDSDEIEEVCEAFCSSSVFGSSAGQC